MPAGEWRPIWEARKAGITEPTQHHRLVPDRLTREYVTDESGAVVKLVIPAGQPNAGTYLVSWNGHGDALNLVQVAKGSATLANSFAYDTWGAATVSTHNGIGDLGFRFRYVGQFGVQDDAVHDLPLHLMGARHYAPELGGSSSRTPRRPRTTTMHTPGTTPSPESIRTASGGGLLPPWSWWL